MRRGKTLVYLKQTWPLYVFLLPALVTTVLFSYAPMYGIQIAFKNFKPLLGIWGSEWVGFRHITRFLNTPGSWRLIRNTFLLSFYSLLWGFPIPILLAIALNELRSRTFRKTAQMLMYAPHFLSTVAVCGLIQLFLRQETGLANLVLHSLGAAKHNFLSDPSAFRTTYIASDIWQSAGWGTIIYMAALSGVDMESLEAATIDGASRLQKIRYIQIPTIMPTIVILLILNTGSLLSVGFEKVFLLQNDLILDVADVISTYVYRLGILGGQFSYTTAIGFFNAVVNACILLLVNFIAGRVGETSFF